jgi:hypothetical protein
MLKRLWNDDCGAVVMNEVLFLIALVVLGSVAGMVAMRNALVSQMSEAARSVMSLNMSYSFSGQSNARATTPGSALQTSDLAGVPQIQHPCD